jgi:Secretion system C-terminal sorting domain
LPETAVRIYPNPSQGVMTVDMLENTQGVAFNMSVYNLLGQLVFSLKNIQQSQWLLNKADIGQGMFLVEINQGEKTVTKRVFFD